MASISFLLGMIPSTEKVEKADDQLRADFKAFKEFENSEELNHFLELEKEVTSSQFTLRKKKILKEKYKNSEAYHKEVRYNQLLKKQKGDEQPPELKELESYINSEEFIKRKQFLTMRPKERYETTEEYQKESEYQELKKSEKIDWYFRTKKKYPFKELEKWECTFEDQFKGGKLDTAKWMTRYYWGEETLDRSFVLEDDKSFITGENIEFYDNKVRIVTKSGRATGLAWRAGQGFVEEDFDFTTGMLSTARSFKQKYGIFKAKVKMAEGSVAQSFWMGSDGMLPHIDVARYENGKLYSNYFWGSGSAPHKSISKTGGGKYEDDFFIFTLEWTPNKLVWKINDKVFKTQTSAVPQDPMHINFSANLKKDASDRGLPNAMEVDWIRVYKLKES